MRDDQVQDCEAAPGRFCAYAVDEGPRLVHATPEARSFEEAALLFTEVWHPAADDQGEVAIMVVDKETGAQRCYTVDIGSGEAEPCR